MKEKNKMNVSQYVELAKKELDDFEKMWNDGIQKAPNDWPKELNEEEWGDQEIATRFE